MRSLSAATLMAMSRDDFIGLLRFALLFVSAFTLMQWAYQALAATGAYRFYIETLTVRPSAALLQLLVPADQVMAVGHRLVWPGGRLSLLKGCDGSEALFLLLAAFIAIRMSGRRRLWGMLNGVLLVYLLNQARIVALYFAVRHDRATFDLLHGLVGPLLVIVTASVFFAWWTQADAASHAV